MLSQIPIQLGAVRKEDLDKEILRAAIVAELDAINLYEQMAAQVRNPDIRDILLDVAREEKTHVGEFQALLHREDPQHAAEMLAGEREVREKANGTKHAA
jgi:rubrerythrin